MGWGKEWRARGSKGRTPFDRGAYRNQFESVLRQWAQGPPKWIYKFSIQQVVPFLKHSFPGKKKFQTLLADAMHTFMTTTLIKKLNIWGLGFLCPPCSWTCAPREKYRALFVWSLPSVWVASCSSEGTHTDNHIPFQISKARKIIPFDIVSDAGPTSWPHHSKLAPLRI